VNDATLRALLARFELWKRQAMKRWGNIKELRSKVEDNWSLTYDKDDDRASTQLLKFFGPRYRWDLLADRKFTALVQKCYDDKRTRSWCNLLWYFGFECERDAKTVLNALQNGLLIPERLKIFSYLPYGLECKSLSLVDLKLSWITPFVCKKNLWIQNVEGLRVFESAEDVNGDVFFVNSGKIVPINTLHADASIFIEKTNDACTSTYFSVNDGPMPKVYIQDEAKKVADSFLKACFTGNVDEVHNRLNKEPKQDIKRALFYACWGLNLGVFQRLLAELNEKPDYFDALVADAIDIGSNFDTDCRSWFFYNNLRWYEVYHGLNVLKEVLQSRESVTPCGDKLVKRNGSATIKDHELKYLPDGIQCPTLILQNLKGLEYVCNGLTVGELQVTGCSHLKELGKKIQVSDTLTIMSCPMLSKIPSELVPVTVELKNLENIKSLPEDLYCEQLVIDNCANLKEVLCVVTQKLIISSCKSLRTLPEGLYLRSIKMTNLDIFSLLPDKLVCAEMSVSRCPCVEVLPKSIHILNRLDIEDSKMLSSRSVTWQIGSDSKGSEFFQGQTPENLKFANVVEGGFMLKEHNDPLTQSLIVEKTTFKQGAKKDRINNENLIEDDLWKLKGTRKATELLCVKLKLDSSGKIEDKIERLGNKVPITEDFISIEDLVRIAESRYRDTTIKLLDENGDTFKVISDAFINLPARLERIKDRETIQERSSSRCVVKEQLQKLKKRDLESLCQNLGISYSARDDKSEFQFKLLMLNVSLERLSPELSDTLQTLFKSPEQNGRNDEFKARIEALKKALANQAKEKLDSSGVILAFKKLNLVD